MELRNHDEVCEHGSREPHSIWIRRETDNASVWSGRCRGGKLIRPDWLSAVAAVDEQYTLMDLDDGPSMREVASRITSATLRLTIE